MGLENRKQPTKLQGFIDNYHTHSLRCADAVHPSYSSTMNEKSSASVSFGEPQIALALRPHRLVIFWQVIPQHAAPIDDPTGRSNMGSTRLPCPTSPGTNANLLWALL